MHEIENSEPRELTDEQRDKIREFFDEHPDGGYKSACKHAGLLRLTKTEARDLIEADPDLAEHRERKLGIDEDSAWKRVATIAANIEHKDALRANTFILAAIHGRHDQQRQIDVNHSGEVNQPDVAEAVERLNQLVSAAALRGAPAGRPRELPRGTD